MPDVNLSVEEARAVSVLRAINDFAHEGLIDKTDLGDVIQALEDVADLDKLESGPAVELKQYVAGFVGGMAATRIADVQKLQQELAYLQQHRAGPSEGEFVGGPTGGVALQQGEDPSFVTQSGVHDNT